MKSLKSIILKIAPTMPKCSSRIIHLAVVSLAIFGSMMVLSTYAGQDPTKTDFWKEVIQSIAYFILAYYLMCIVAKHFNIRRMKNAHWIIGGFLMIAMIATLFFPGVNGAHSWITIASFSVQPVEFVKIFMIVVLALYIELIKQSKRSLISMIKVPLLYYLIFAVLIALQRDFGSLVILTLIVVGLVFCTTLEKFQLLQKILLGLGVVGIAALIFCFTDAGIKFLSGIPAISHFAVRFQNTLNPFLDTSVGGYQMSHGLYSIARGGLGGVGLGGSIQKYGYLTQSESDYIFAIILEETGVLGLIFIFFGYFLILYRLFFYAFKAKSEGYRFILIGTAIYIFSHFFLNVGGVSGIVPLTGIPLLFISSGGSSLLATMMGIGVTQSVISTVRRSGSAQKRKKRATS